MSRPYNPFTPIHRTPAPPPSRKWRVLNWIATAVVNIAERLRK